MQGTDVLTAGTAVLTWRGRTRRPEVTSFTAHYLRRLQGQNKSYGEVVYGAVANTDIGPTKRIPPILRAFNVYPAAQRGICYPNRESAAHAVVADPWKLQTSGRVTVGMTEGSAIST